ncbi:type II toxin-antitoxin system HicA family toxin [Actinocorallia sp. A-T 12471]|uniref:type II toxin-antitoxin system HicA family toxin n=1 Tax=Actinocorallia sp. A-T 12471 TaxID=3089813 RepID=UPI0039B6F849
MKLRDLVRALLKHGCSVRSDTGRHTKWICPCGRHTAILPRHREVSPGVVGDTVDRLKCLPEGWLR